ncbi:MAG: transglutaminase TgpA family protein [Candidatus Limnocylindria bacterium]
MADLRERLLRPRAGWLSLGLLAVMALSVAWSVQGAGWLEQLEYLAPVALWAVLAGALLGMLRWSVVATLPLGAMIGAAVVLWAVGGEYFAAADQAGRFAAMRADLIDWTVIVLRTGYPPQMSPYAIGLGMLMWVTAFIAAYVVYRYHRVLDTIVLLGAAIITNMSATFTDLFGHLLLFVIAALLLWLRASLVTRQDGWQRRRVNENLEVPAAIMRSGIAVAAGSVALAWILTTVAVAAPLTGAWRSLDGVWTGVRDQFEGVFGSLTNPQSRITGSSFGPSFTVFGEWVSNDEEVLVLAAERAHYLRTGTYDVYTGRGWERTDGEQRRVPAGELLFEGATAEYPLVAAAVDVEDIAIEMRQVIGRNIFTAGSPLRVFVPTLLQESGGLPVLGSIDAPQAPATGQTYEVRVAISQANEAELIAAGTDYPEDVRALYLDDTGVTDRVAELARDVTAGVDTPYEQAKRLSQFLRGSDFTYTTVGPQVPRDGDLVDTFLFAEDGRTGYCQYYASAMAVMARSLGIPARVAVGFAPGEDIGDDLYLVREANAHAWVEVYFPGYGWEIFEATKSINPRFARQTDDSSRAETPFLGPEDWLEREIPLDVIGGRGIDALPSPVFAPGAIDTTLPEAADEPRADGAQTGNAFVIAVLVLIGLVAVWWQMRRAERRWRLLPAGDRAWRRLTAAAERAGVGPRPSETIYEYAGWLEEQLPTQGEPIRTVADGKVWQAYSGRRLSWGASQRLEGALARLRLPLVGLAVRRRLRQLTRRKSQT